jgi:hypothetical protein
MGTTTNESETTKLKRLANMAEPRRIHKDELIADLGYVRQYAEALAGDLQNNRQLALFYATRMANLACRVQKIIHCKRDGDEFII